MPPQVPPTTGAAGSGPAPASGQRPTLQQKLIQLASNAQFFWFVGHLATLTLSVMYIAFTRFLASGSRHYARALYGTLLSYGIILYKSHGAPQISKGYLQRVMMDENTQYLLMALLWATSKPVWVVLIPYATFSLFHTMNYLRTTLLPSVMPMPGLQNQMLNFTTTYQPKALRAVAYLEVFVILPYLIVGILFGWVSLFTPLLFAQFLRFRFFFSPLTREAFGEAQRRGDELVARPGVPVMVKDLWGKLCTTLTTFGDLTQQQGGAPQPAQR